MKKILFKPFVWVGVLALCSFVLQGQKIEYSSNWGKQGLTIESQKAKSLSLNYSITEFSIAEQEIKGENLKTVQLPGTFLPNDAGMPDLPGNGHMIAIPQGATATLKVVDYQVETISDISVAPAPVIPLETDDEPLKYEKNAEVYSQDVFYPANPFQLSKQKKLRGVDLVTLGITPFQYNPVKKELKIFRDVKLEVVFEGGKGKYGDNKYRSRFWDPILHQNIINFDALPKIDYAKKASNSKNNEFEYVIITLNDPDFLSWADSLAEFRRKQGISTGVFTVDDVGGNTVSAIEGWIDNAYNNWATPPAAILLLADYSTGSGGIISHLYDHPSWYPDYASDSKYADVDGDDLPEIVLARITANNASQLETMVTKVLDYERTPPTSTDYYNKPITALGWQTERWFQICSETIGGYWSNVLGKTPERINAVYGGNPNSDPWSTATNTSTVLDYFGPNGEGYIPASPSTLGGWTGGTGQDVINAINGGSFMLQHRDHGSYTGWGEPDFGSSDINSLQNINNELTFVLSINCQTGAFHNSSECFAEKFHRHTYNNNNSGALGIIAATEVSYSFVNDTYVWGAYDNMWPDFLPDYSTQFPVNFIYPAFANAAGKHFLYQSSWPYNTSNKQVTYRLFHHHGDAFLNVYSEVPQNLTVNCPSSHVFGTSTIDISADADATIAVSYYNTTTQETEILGTAVSTGGNNTINLSTVPNPGTDMLVTITKQDYYRYTNNVTVISPSGPFDVVDSYVINDGGNNQAEFGETFDLDITVKNVGVASSDNVQVTLTTSDPNVVSLTNASNVNFGNIAPDATATSSGNFTVELADDIVDQTAISFDVTITDNSKETYTSILSFNVNAPALSIGGLTVDDTGTGNGDGILDPGETADIIIQASNNGHADVSNVIGAISSSSTHLTINTSSTSPVTLNTGNTEDFIFNVTADAATPVGTPADIDFTVTAGANNQYTATETKQTVIGEIPVYLMTDGSETSCTGYFYDSGGPSGDFSNNESFTFTFYPATAGSMIQAEFTFFDCGTQGSGWDYLEIYDGESTSDPLIISSDAAGASAMLSTFTATNSEGALTFYFHSTSVVPNPGWEANISCFNMGPAGGTAIADPAAICESGTTELILNDWSGDSMQWQSSTDGSTWANISGATSTPYTTSVLTETAYFRAEVSKSGYDPAYSNEISVPVNTTPIPGTASASETEICEDGNVTFTLAGYDGSIQWQNSTDGSTWNDIAGAISDTYTTVALSNDMYYRAKVYNAGCDDDFSNEILIAVHASPTAAFSHVIDGGEATFTNESENADAYSWDFGDGAGTSTDENPVYTYTENATYTVVLTASNSYCPGNEVSEDIDITTISINELANMGIEIFPNPNKGIFHVSTSLNDVELSIMDNTGKIVYKQELTNETVKIDISHFANGNYFLRFVSEEKVVHTKIIKQ